MLWRRLGISGLFCGLLVCLNAMPAAAMDHASHAAAGEAHDAGSGSHATHGGMASPGGWQASYDFFTNFGSYMPRIHCMRTADGTPDWPWIIGLAILNVVVIAGYLKIFVFWRQCHLAEKLEDRDEKLMDLARIFLLCATCGYAMFLVTLYWPAYRLLAFLMVGLSIVTWRFALDLNGFRLTFTAKRLQRELNEHLQQKNDELERTVAARTSELERANAFKRTFLANISHEIRTPMTAILGFTDLLDYEKDNPQAQSEHISTIRRNGEHLVSLLNDVLDLSKIEAGKLKVERVDCDVRRIIQDVVDTFSCRAAAGGVALVSLCDGALPAKVKTDPLRLRQVLNNLVNNAMKFTSAGQITIETSFERDEANKTGVMSISVHDTGCGISEEDLRTVFAAFEQAETKQSRRAVGTGLGLTISRELARLMGGNLTATSAVGEGSTFIATIDTGDISKHEMVECAEVPAVHMPGMTFDQEALAGVNLLIAEDAADSQRLLHTVMTRSGATVTIVDDGIAVVDAALNSGPFDLILMDMQMPQQDGLSATRQLRDSGYSGPIVALTANALLVDRDRCLAAGCDEYASKPINPTALIKIIRSCLHTSSV